MAEYQKLPSGDATLGTFLCSALRLLLLLPFVPFLLFFLACCKYDGVFGFFRRAAHWPLLGHFFVQLWQVYVDLGVIHKVIFFQFRSVGYSPSIHRPERMEYAANYEPTEDDVFVATHFRSGTTLTVHMAYQVATKGNRDFEHINQECPWIEAIHHVGMEEAEVRPRVIKTHMPLSQLPWSDRAKYIYICRNPCDVAVSQHSFFAVGLLGKLQLSMRAWVSLFCKGVIQYGSWWDHVRGYWEKRDLPNVLFLRYEDIIADRLGAVRQVADFMGIPLTDAEAETCATKIGFDWMKEHADKFAPRFLADAKQFIRRGKAGKSKETMTVGMRRQIIDACKRGMEGSEFDFGAYDELAGEP